MATDYDTARFNYENFRYCYDNGHRDWLVKAARCFDFWRSRQWSDADRAKLRRAGRPALTINVIGSLVRSAQGMQRALRNDVRFSPVADADEQTAQAQDALWLHIQNQNQLDFLESEVYTRGIITGRGYYDVRVDFDESMQGNAKICAPRAQDVVLDPAFLDYDPASWPQVYTTPYVNLLDIQHMFGAAAAEELSARTPPGWYDIDDIQMGKELGSLPYYVQGFSNGEIDAELVRAFRLLNRQFYVLKRKEVFVDVATGDTSEIPETWDRNRIAHVLETVPGLSVTKRNVKTVRWTVTCENTVLHDEDSPYKWLTVVPFFPTMIDGETIGAVEDLLDPQELYNKVTSQELHIINTTANSGWVTKVGNIKNYTAEQLEEKGAQTGLVLEVDNPEATQKIQPNQVPSGHDRISFKADQIMRSLFGVSNQARGFAREDVASEAILANQAATDVNLAGYLANLHRSKQLLATRVLDCVQAYYTETRAIMINRGSTFRPEFQTVTINQPTPEGAVLNDVTQGKYTTVLVPSPARTTLTESEFETLLKLKTEAGIAIPDDLMIELAPIANKLQIIQKLKGDSNDQQAQLAQLQMQNAQLEQQLLQARAQKEQSAAALNDARANKAQVEAQNDPDAAYERVESARIASDAAVERDRIASNERIENQRVGLERRSSDRDTAIQLTKIQSENQRHTQKLLADVAKTRVPPKQPTKTPAGAKAA
jgi:hypothetical protein